MQCTYYCKLIIQLVSLVNVRGKNLDVCINYGMQLEV